MAYLEGHISKQIYMPAMHLSAQCNEPAKSIPVWENGEPSETLQADKSGEG